MFNSLYFMISISVYDIYYTENSRANNLVSSWTPGSIMSYPTAFVWFVILTLTSNAFAFPPMCPRFSSASCSCYYTDDVGPHHAECRGLGYRMLKTAFRESQNFKTFSVVGSNLTTIDKKLFFKYSLETLELKFCKVQTEFVFDALTVFKNLKSLIINSVRVKRWTFPRSDENKLGNMTKLTLLDCPVGGRHDNMVINYLPNNMTEIRVKWCKLQSEGISFRRFTNLRILDLSNNLLTYIDGEFLPKPTKELRLLSLSQNPITFLPDDMFEHMPKLKKLYLESTIIATFSYVSLHPLLHQLESIQVAHSPFRCDCYNSWILTRIFSWNSPYYVCSSPPKLQGQRLENLTPKDMCQPEGEQYKDFMDEYCRKEPNYNLHMF